MERTWNDSQRKTEVLEMSQCCWTGNRSLNYEVRGRIGPGYGPGFRIPVQSLLSAILQPVGLV